MRGTLPLKKPIRVRIGQHRVDLKAPGFTPANIVVSVAAEHRTRERMVLSPSTFAVGAGGAGMPEGGDAAIGKEVTSTGAETSGRRLRTVGVVLGAAGAAAVVAGVVFGLKARSLSDKSKAAGTSDPATDESGHRYQTLQYVGYGVGAALLVGGVTTFVLGGLKPEPTGPQSISFVSLPGGGFLCFAGAY